jgi:hypothetical protein
MRLLAATVALLGWRSVHAIPTFGELGSYPVVIEQATSSGHFVDPELQQRALRFYNQATARESCSPACKLRLSDFYQLLL